MTDQSKVVGYLSSRQGEQGAEEHVLLVADESISVKVHHG